MINLDDKTWFVVATRCWRLFQCWGFAVAGVLYAFRAVFGYDFDVATFTALATFGGIQVAIRGLEKFGKQKMESA